jgi:hypothetical protein
VPKISRDQPGDQSIIDFKQETALVVAGKNKGRQDYEPATVQDLNGPPPAPQREKPVMYLDRAAVDYGSIEMTARNKFLWALPYFAKYYLAQAK